MVRFQILAIASTLLALQAQAQGFAGLGSDIEGYALPSRDTQFVFPKDHGAHPEFRIEWWYLTTNLEDENGTQYGVQWTLFRNATSPSGRPDHQVWMGHAAVSSPDGHFFAERLARGAHRHAGVRASPFVAFIDEWQVEGVSLSEVSVFAQGSDFAFDLALKASLPFVPHGENGFSTKSQTGQASHYYSQPFYGVVGTLTLPAGTVSVTGQGWLDREWSSQPLAPDQKGWDWFSIHLENGEKLMGFQLRSEQSDTYSVGTVISPDGMPKAIEPGSIEMTAMTTERVAGRNVPIVWNVSVPTENIDIQMTALYPQSWMNTLVPYWEGPVTVSGTHSGVGYLEMTGYE